MIAFGTSITDVDMYRRCAEPGIQLAAEPDSEVLAFSAAGSIFRSYNLLMEKALEFDGLEALVLVHQDAEIADPDFCAKLRERLADPEVGLVGCVGAVGVRSIAWWEGSVSWASFTHRYGEFGGGDVPAFAWEGEDRPPYARTGEVDTIDGFVMCMPPWTLQNVRFDESLGQLHGYDFDFCLSVRDQGKKVLTEDFQVIHHHSLDLVSEPETWIAAHMRVAEKWDGRMPGVGAGSSSDWKERARRAEAEAAATRAQVVTKELQNDARIRLWERQLKEIEDSVSWRATKPLRDLRLSWRERRKRSAASRAPGESRLPARDGPRPSK